MGVLSTFCEVRTEEGGPIIHDKRPEIFLRALGDLSADARGEDSHCGSPKLSLGAARRRYRGLPDCHCRVRHRLHCRPCCLTALPKQIESISFLALHPETYLTRRLGWGVAWLPGFIRPR